MTLRKTLLMALVLALGVFWVLRYEKPEESEKATPPGKIFSLSSAKDITELVVEMPRFSYELKRQQDDSWIISEPKGAPLKENILLEVLKTVSGLQRKGTIPKSELPDGNFEAFGLDLPEGRIIVKSTNGQEAAFIGKKHPFTAIRYVRKEGDANVYIVDDYAVNKVLRDGRELLEMKPFFFSERDLLAISVQRPDGISFEISRDNDASPWVYQGTGGNFSVDKELFEHLVSKISGVEADEIIPVVGEELPGGQALLTLIVRKKNQDQSPVVEEYSISEVVSAVKKPGKNGENVFYGVKKKDAPVLYQVDWAFFNDFLQSPEHFRQRNILADVQLTDVESFTFCEGNENCRMVERKEGKWVEGEGSSVKTIDEGKMANYFKALHSIRILTFIPLTAGERQSSGVDSPTAQFRMREKGNVIEVKWGKAVEASGSASKEGKDLAPRYVLFRKTGQSDLFGVVSGSIGENLP